jgi:hypothetical protein
MCPRCLHGLKLSGQSAMTAGEGGERARAGSLQSRQDDLSASLGMLFGKPEGRLAQHDVLAQVPIPAPLLGEDGPCIPH